MMPQESPECRARVIMNDRGGYQPCFHAGTPQPKMKIHIRPPLQFLVEHTDSLKYLAAITAIRRSVNAARPPRGVNPIVRVSHPKWMGAHGDDRTRQYSLLPWFQDPAPAPHFFPGPQ